MSWLARVRNVWAAAKGAAVVVEAGAQVIKAATPAGGKSMSAFQTIEAAATFLNTDPRAKTLIALSQKIVDGEAAQFMAAVHAHDWKTVTVDVLEEALTAAATFGVPGAGFALKLLPLVVFAAEHPEDTLAPAMRKAAGSYDNPYDHPGNALDVGVTVG